MPTRLRIPGHLSYVLPIVWQGIPGLCCSSLAIHPSFKRTPWHLQPVVW